MAEREKGKFRIVFTGQYAEGRKPEHVQRAVAGLFHVEPGRVEAAFAKGKGAVLASASDMAQAERLAHGLKQAGALCVIEPAGESVPREPVPKTSDASAHASGKSSAKISAKISGNAGRAPENKQDIKNSLPDALIVRTAIGPTDITLAPLSVTRITGHALGIDINRRDRRLLEFSSIVAASVFKASEDPERFKLLLFFDGSKRPLLLDCEGIAYGDFPGVKAEVMLSSLRNFLTMLYAQRHGLILDEPTAGFIAGGPPGLFLKDSLLLATGLYLAMPQERRPAPPASIPYGAVAEGLAAGPTAIIAKDTIERCQKCGARLSAGRLDCTRCGFIPIKAAPARPKTVPPEARAMRLALWAAGGLAIAVLIPLLKFAFGARTVVFWPWQFFGLWLGEDQTRLLAQFFERSWYGLRLWSAIPLCIGAVVLVASRLRPGRRFPLIAIGAGFGLAAMLVPLAPYSAVLGVALLPRLWYIGALLLIAALPAFWLVHTGGAGKSDGKLMRALCAIALIGSITLLIIYGGWRSWWLLPVYAAAGLLGLFGLMDASGLLSGDGMSGLYRRLGLWLAVGFMLFFPMASIRSDALGFSSMAAGRLLFNLIGYAKALLIFGSAAVVLYAGLKGMRLEPYIKPAQKSEPKSPSKPPAKTLPTMPPKTPQKSPSKPQAKTPPNLPIDRQSRKS